MSNRKRNPQKPSKAGTLARQTPERPTAAMDAKPFVLASRAPENLNSPGGYVRELTPEEYKTASGRIFIGIGGFKPPAGKTYKPDPL
jgi:hypothetical protein